VERCRTLGGMRLSGVEPGGNRWGAESCGRSSTPRLRAARVGVEGVGRERGR